MEYHLLSTLIVMLATFGCIHVQEQYQSEEETAQVVWFPAAAYQG